MPLRAVLALLLVALLHLVAAHELCVDSLDPLNVQNSFCPEYSGHSCCSPERDAQIAAEFNAITPQPPDNCLVFLRHMFCAECDPWSAHLYGAEVNVNPSTTPAMCDQYCLDFYRACGSLTINWSGFPGGVSPFNGANPLVSQYPEERLFCKIYAAPSSATVCYSGAKVVPPTPVPADADSTGTCIERLGDNSMDPNLMIVSVVSAHDDSNYLYVQFKRGDIQIWDKDTGNYVSTFMTLPFPILNSDGEAGFTSLVFHPQYKDNGRFFVHYSTLNFSIIGCPVDSSGNDLCGTSQGCANGACVADHVSVVSEYRRSAADPLKADLDSERRLMIQAQPFRIHNCGQLLFGPEGHLYIMWGDGGSRFDPYQRAQNPSTWLGKLLRVDVDSPADANLPYHIPVDNPFYGQNAYAGRWETYATGFRHSWRCSFDRNNMSRLFCGDVGQERREEVNLVEKGKNYGWSVFEGTLITPSYPTSTPYTYEPPIIEYEHYDLGGSPAVIGGYVSYSTRDACLKAKYLYGDWQGVVWAASVNASKQWDSRQTLLFLAPGPKNPSYWAGIGDLFGFGEDDEGDIYLLAQTGIYRVVERTRCELPASCTATAPPRPSSTPPPTTLAPTTLPSNSPSPSSPATSAPARTTSTSTRTTSTSSTTTPLSTTGKFQSDAMSRSASAALLFALVGLVLTVIFV